MKLKLFLSAVFLILSCSPAFSFNDAGLRYINTRGVIRCGISTDNKTLAYKEEESPLRGIAVEICRLISTAVFGRSDRIKIVALPESMISKAFSEDKIDVMIGGMSYSASNEVTQRAAPIDVIFYERLMFMSRDAQNATSMRDFAETNICLAQDPDTVKKLRAFDQRNNLNFKILPLDSFFKAKGAFFLKRCNLLVGEYLSLKSVLKDNTTVISKLEILPEVIAVRPVYLFADRENTSLRTILKWVMNAPKLAEEIGLNKENYELNLSSKDPVVSCLLGTDKKLWKEFGLEQDWVQIMLREQGNYGEIFEKALGEKSPFKLKREQNNLQKNGGLITSYPFL